MSGLSDFSFIDAWNNARARKLVGRAFGLAADEVVNSIAQQIPEIAALHTKMAINKAVQSAASVLKKLASKMDENCTGIANIIVCYDENDDNNDTIDERIDLSKKLIGADIYQGKEILQQFKPNDYSSDDPRFRIIDLWDKLCGALNSPNIQLRVINFMLYPDVQDLRDDLNVAVNKGREIAIFMKELEIETLWLNTEFNKLPELKRHYLKAALEETLPERPACREILDYVTEMPQHRLEI